MAKYRDINVFYNPNEGVFNSTNVDLENIKQSLLRLFTTRKGSVPFNRNYGSNLYSLLFENNVDESDISTFLYMDITDYEPRVSLNPSDISITRIDNNSFRVDCTFRVPSLNNVSSSVSTDISTNDSIIDPNPDKGINNPLDEDPIKYPFDVILDDKLTVVSREFDLSSAKKQFTNNSMECSIDFMVTYNNGKVVRDTLRHVFPHSLVSKSNWSVDVYEVDFHTEKATKYTTSSYKTDGEWEWQYEVSNISADVTITDDDRVEVVQNIWESKEANDIKVTLNGISYSFGRDDYEFNNDLDESQTIDKKVMYKNRLTYTFGSSDTKHVDCEGLIVYKEDVRTEYRFENESIVADDGKVTFSGDLVAIYGSGKIEKTKITKYFQYSLVQHSSHWSVDGNPFNVIMDNIEVSDIAIISSEEDLPYDLKLRYDEYNSKLTRSMHVDGNTRDFKWSLRVPTLIRICDGDVTVYEHNIHHATINGGWGVVPVEETEEYNLYNVECTARFKFLPEDVISSEDYFSSLITNELKELKNIEPAEHPWGKMVSATCTVSQNESNTDWVYTWSIHFEHGTLPVILSKDASSLSLNESLFTDEVVDSFNGAAYVNGRWVNTRSFDGNSMMIWQDGAGKTISALNYVSASMMNWNRGNNSVFNSDFSFTIVDDGHTLRIDKGSSQYFSTRFASIYVSAERITVVNYTSFPIPDIGV